MQKGITSMNINECYQAMGADYEEVFGRLRNERLITATLTEVLRAGNLPEDDNMMNAVAKEYERTVAAIEQLNA